MSGKPRWEPDDDDGGWVLDIGVMTLHVDNDDVGLGWCAIASHEPHQGIAATVEAAKFDAMKCAREELTDALERLAQLEAAAGKKAGS